MHVVQWLSSSISRLNLWVRFSTTAPPQALPQDHLQVLRPLRRDRLPDLAGHAEAAQGGPLRGQSGYDSGFRGPTSRTTIPFTCRAPDPDADSLPHGIQSSPDVDIFIREDFVIKSTVGPVWPGRQLQRRARLGRAGVSAEVSAVISTATALWFTVATVFYPRRSLARSHRGTPRISDLVTMLHMCSHRHGTIGHWDHEHSDTFRPCATQTFVIGDCDVFRNPLLQPDTVTALRTT